MRLPRVGRANPLVLIVDDDAVQAGQIANFLARQGVKVIQESNGFAAVNTMRREQPAVVVMDVKMPGLDGIEAARLAARVVHGPKIILMSGHADYVRRATQADLGIFAVIEKPVPLKSLARFIAQALAGAAPSKSDDDRPDMK